MVADLGLERSAPEAELRAPSLGVSRLGEDAVPDLVGVLYIDPGPMVDAAG